MQHLQLKSSPPQKPNPFGLKLFMFLPLLFLVTLTSCGSAPTGGADQAAIAPEVAEEAAEGGEKASEGATDQNVPKQAPKLIKTANMSLEVESVEESLETISEIAQKQRGDILSLQDNKPQTSRRPHTATVTLRIPQEKLEDTLEQLSELGLVRSQNIQAEDVSNQLVDFEARLKNLRKTENTLLEIMDRSGSMGDVLQVSQELTKVRASIEQIDAQLQDLQTKVAFSTINLELESTTATTPLTKPLGDRITETWKSATHSVGQFTTGLLQLSLWLIAYSPYLAVIAVIAWFSYRLKRKS